MIGNPNEFDAYFREAVAAHQPPQRLNFLARCGQHPEEPMQPLPGQEPPPASLQAGYRMTVACTECGLEVILCFEAATKEVSWS